MSMTQLKDIFPRKTARLDIYRQAFPHIFVYRCPKHSFIHNNAHFQPLYMKHIA